MVLSVYATATILSEIVVYVPNDSSIETTNVKDALDELYGYATISAYDRLSFEAKHNVVYGNRLSSRTINLTLDSGSYIIITYRIVGSATSDQRNQESNSIIAISYDNGECELVDSHANTISGTTSYVTGVYVGYFANSTIYKCNFTNSVTVTATSGQSTAIATLPENLELYAIKLD